MHHDGGHVCWVKSSYSGGSGTECVEASFATRSTAVRDSKRPHGPHLTFAAPSWEAFVAALQEDRLQAP
ncbi:DUF397 domain-containing protein [Streptomyces sp. NPDC059070]|uniref:DUF397 domain-containing protein n=1 Tax=Streptomyces sp. NPDC059070 TaxID=3346713 RepID=UPI0036B90620